VYVTSLTHNTTGRLTHGARCWTHASSWQDTIDVATDGDVTVSVSGVTNDGTGAADDSALDWGSLRDEQKSAAHARKLALVRARVEQVRGGHAEAISNKANPAALSPSPTSGNAQPAHVTVSDTTKVQV
jgi:hypothetical protein